MDALSDRARRERLAGLLTVAAMLLAFALANSPLEHLYRLVHHTAVSIRVGEFVIDRPLIVWINKGLMVGIFGATWLAVRLGAGRLPPGVTWTQVYGISLLGGVGFTMSLFITSLAFAAPETLLSARSAILLGSVASAVAGLLVLRCAPIRRVE